MHLNSWRAAGKKCRKRRPEGKMSHRVWMLRHVCLQSCIVHFFCVCLCLAWGWQCMKIWRRRDGSKRTWKKKRREKNWTEHRLKWKMNERMGKGEEERAQLWTQQAQRLCWPPVFGQQLTNVTQTERRLSFIQQKLENMHKSSSHDMTKGFLIFNVFIYFPFLSAEFTTWMLKFFFLKRLTMLLKMLILNRGYFSKCTFDCKDNWLCK